MGMGIGTIVGAVLMEPSTGCHLGSSLGPLMLLSWVCFEICR
jgi:hypothetical protein